jgi:hypothetical protein
MKVRFGTTYMVLILIGIVTLTLIFPISTDAGYSIVDKEGKVISGDSENIIEVSSSDKRIVFKDRGGSKVFDVEWDASNKKLIVKGDDVYLQIYSTGKIEKLTTIQEGDERQTPIIIEPTVPIWPKHSPSPQTPAPQR